MLELDRPSRPETNAFLLRSMDGNQRLVDFIWRLLGYGLIRDRKEHVFIIFWGEHGRNGKDTLIGAGDARPRHGAVRRRAG